MIAKVGKRGANLWKLVDYLFGPGDHDEHINQRYIATFDGLVERWNGKPHDDLRKIMEHPFREMVRWENGEKDYKYLWHCSISAAKADGFLTDKQWSEIGSAVAEKVGLNENNCRWAVVNHGKNKTGCDHVHLYAVMVNDVAMEPVRSLQDDYTNASTTARSFERKFGLVETGLRNSTGDVALTQGELKKAERLGKRPTRAVLKEKVMAAKNRSRNLDELEILLAGEGVTVDYRYSKVNDGEITGITFGDGNDLGSSPFGGSKLHRTLSWTQLKNVLNDGESYRVSQTKNVPKVELFKKVDRGRADKNRSLKSDDLSVETVNGVVGADTRILDLAEEIVSGLDDRVSGTHVETAGVLMQTAADLTQDSRIVEALNEFERAIPEPWKQKPVATPGNKMLRDLAVGYGLVAGADPTKIVVAAVMLAESVHKLRRRQGDLKQAKTALEAKQKLMKFLATNPDLLADSDVKRLMTKHKITVERTAETRPNDDEEIQAAMARNRQQNTQNRRRS